MGVSSSKQPMKIGDTYISYDIYQIGNQELLYDEETKLFTGNVSSVYRSNNVVVAFNIIEIWSNDSFINTIDKDNVEILANGCEMTEVTGGMTQPYFYIFIRKLKGHKCFSSSQLDIPISVKIDEAYRQKYDITKIVFPVEIFHLDRRGAKIMKNKK